ncbi:atherin [Molossus molossus]|uniref:Sterile alpha motif domain containing 1 n=1 Tax=Molossus molossus TaxID=27622 RepID=A0A7J8IC98_MOLMO|nr:atherin [Molossus molossus]KAF6481931.1 sterile alpha motif domain containing 1 [Molossus molossus]
MAGPPALPPPETAAAATTAAAASSSAASPHYQEWILDTIDSLRSRKARPDLERICRMVRRRHGPEPERTRAELEKLIQQRAVLRVSYKGSISYRNAARVQPPRRGATPPAPPRAPRGGPTAAPPPTPAPPPPPAPVAAAAPARAPRAAAAATAPPSPGPAQPSPRAQRAAPLSAPPPAPAAPLAVAPPTGPRRAPPPAVAARESPLPPPPQPPAPPQQQQQQQQQPPPPQPQQPPEGGAARAGGPARPVSLREVVRYLGGSGGAGGRLTRGRVQGLLEEEAAARGRLERTRLGALALSRGDRPGRALPAASARASRSKRGGEERLLEKEEEEEEDDDDEDEDDEDNVSEGSEVLEGDRPAVAQHHQLNGERGPQSAKERVKEWTPCGLHQGQDEGRGPAPGSGTRQVFSMAAMNKEGGSASAATGPDSPSPVPLPPGKPALPGGDGNPFGCPSGRKEKPTDPVEWTVMDVVEYFTEAGFPEQATAFQEQEIDGKSLLLMQRTDVLTGLSIRLGPALKIYEHHIKVLQQGHFEDDDPDGFLG